MNKDKLSEEIAEDEGCKYEIYLDHLGLPTTGIGHLITESDEEHGKPVGTVVEQERVKQLFALDMIVTLDECKVLYPDFDDLPEECQHIIANMMFNMGRPRLSKFKGMKPGSMPVIGTPQPTKWWTRGGTRRFLTVQGA